MSLRDYHEHEKTTGGYRWAVTMTIIGLLFFLFILWVSMPTR